MAAAHVSTADGPRGDGDRRARRARRVRDWTLRLALGGYLAASLLHFVHNAEFLSDWPNLPAALSRAAIYATWVGITAAGAAGYLLWRRGWRRIGAGLLAVYAAVGFDGLLHYTRAPMRAHTATMNFTVWFEAVAAAVLLIAIAIVSRRERAA